MILGLAHAALAVPDMKKALDFYCGVMGFEVVMEADIPPGFEPMNAAFGIANASCAVRMVRKGNSCIELFEFADAKAGDPRRPVNLQGITHIAMSTDDIDGDYEHLQSNGVAFNAPLFGEAPSRFAYGRDPFGNVIELLEYDPASPTSLDFKD